MVVLDGGGALVFLYVAVKSMAMGVGVLFDEPQLEQHPAAPATTEVVLVLRFIGGNVGGGGCCCCCCCDSATV